MIPVMGTRSARPPRCEVGLADVIEGATRRHARPVLKQSCPLQRFSEPHLFSRYSTFLAANRRNANLQAHALFSFSFQPACILHALGEHWGVRTVGRRCGLGTNPAALASGGDPFGTRDHTCGAKRARPALLCRTARWPHQAGGCTLYCRHPVGLFFISCCM